MAKLLLAEMSPGEINSLVEEVSGLSMDASIGSQDGGRHGGINFTCFIELVEDIIAKHGCAIRHFDVDNPACDHWATQDRGVVLGVAKCFYCYRHTAVSDNEMVATVGTEVSICPGCQMPFHSICAIQRNLLTQAMYDKGLCGSCEKFLAKENRFNGWMWSRVLRTVNRYW